jgi:CBS-domain-containing membrane protein
VRRYAEKFRGTVAAPPPRPALGHTVISWLGALLAIATLGWLSDAARAPLMLASFGASCVLLFGYPDSHFSQPRNTIGGHVLAALLGLSAVAVLGEGWPAMAVAVATAIAAMKVTGTVHPPAGSTAIIAVHLHPGWSFVALPTLLGAVVLVGMAAAFNNVVEHRRYPLYWL